MVAISSSHESFHSRCYPGEVVFVLSHFLRDVLLHTGLKVV